MSAAALGSFLVKPNIPCINVPLQYFDVMRNELARLNVPDGKGADFADLGAHFIVCSDEACLMAGARGGVKVLGDVDKAKHEKIINDSRASITIMRCASTAGSTGPTNFVMHGTKLKEGYTDKFLLRHGAAPGSSFAISPSGFMTREA